MISQTIPKTCFYVDREGRFCYTQVLCLTCSKNVLFLRLKNLLHHQYLYYCVLTKLTICTFGQNQSTVIEHSYLTQKVALVTIRSPYLTVQSFQIDAKYSFEDKLATIGKYVNTVESYIDLGGPKKFVNKNAIKSENLTPP